MIAIELPLWAPVPVVILTRWSLRAPVDSTRAMWLMATPTPASRFTRLPVGVPVSPASAWMKWPVTAPVLTMEKRLPVMAPVGARAIMGTLRVEASARRIMEPVCAPVGEVISRSWPVRVPVEPERVMVWPATSVPMSIEMPLPVGTPVSPLSTKRASPVVASESMILMTCPVVAALWAMSMRWPVTAPETLRSRKAPLGVEEMLHSMTSVEPVPVWVSRMPLPVRVPASVTSRALAATAVVMSSSMPVPVEAPEWERLIAAPLPVPVRLMSSRTAVAWEWVKVIAVSSAVMVRPLLYALSRPKLPAEGVETASQEAPS